MVEIKFDLSKAQDIQNGILFGKIKTRDGFDVRLLNCNLNSNYPVAGVVRLDTGDEYVKQWTSDGRSHLGRVCSYNDLVLEVEGGEV